MRVKLPESRLQRFLEAVAAEWRAHPSRRYGQTVFNTLLDWDPGYAEEIRATDLDPFLDNNRTGAMLEALRVRWEGM